MDFFFETLLPPDLSDRAGVNGQRASSRAQAFNNDAALGPPALSFVIYVAGSVADLYSRIMFLTVTVYSAEVLETLCPHPPCRHPTLPPSPSFYQL